MIRLDESIWVGDVAEAPHKAVQPLAAVLDLTPELQLDVPTGRCARFPLDARGRGQAVMVDAAARAARRLEAEGPVAVVGETGSQAEEAVAAAMWLHDGLTSAEASARARAVFGHELSDGWTATLADLERWRLEVRPEHRMVKAGDTELHALHCPGSGPKLVLFHGAYGSWTHWFHNVRGLADTFDLWLFDLPGFGESDDWPGPLVYDAYCETLAQAVRQVAPEGGILGGYSFGATLAAEVLTRAPGLARAGVLVAFMGRTGDPARHRQVVERRFPDKPTFADRLAVVAGNLGDIHLHRPERLDDQAVFMTYRNILNTRLGYARMRQTTPRPHPLELLGGVPVPLLMVWGLHDPFCQPTVPEWAAACREAAPGVEPVILPHAAHWCQYEEPDAFNQAVQMFAGRVSEASARPRMR
jgi:2-hydroxy-6-oxonona-2,4-dienedioate hydrolase